VRIKKKHYEKFRSHFSLLDCYVLKWANTFKLKYEHSFSEADVEVEIESLLNGPSIGNFPNYKKILEIEIKKLKQH
jgi:hypothetical protein